MRNLLLSALSLSVLSAAAVTLDVARLPGPSFADREVSSDTALPANRLDLLRTFRLEMTFYSTPSNNVQAAFGRDAMSADGALSSEETDFIIGNDCGEWFLRPQGLKEWYTFTPADAQTSRTRTLTASIRVDAQGIPKTVSFTDDAGAFTFQGLTLSPVPQWLRPDLWTCMRVTTRGYTGTNETVRARFLQDGARIILR
jgi:hypothetical protein